VKSKVRQFFSFDQLPLFVFSSVVFRHIRHTNISCLLGICIQPQDALSLMIYERLNDGDLHEYLLQRSTTIALYQQRDLTDFLCISIQIISGMIYLAEKNFVHNDLSAKNILISEHMDIKISNIARYRPKYDADYYKIANRSLPVRWMAIESLLSGIYTEMSDVWSFGVLLWEMFSYGALPYYGRTNPEVIEMIRDRKLLTCPANCPKRIYALMFSCWEELSEQRPTFVELMGRLRQFEEKSATLSSTASSSLIDVPPVSGNQGDLPTPKYRTFISPPPPPPPVRNDALSTSGRTAPQSMLADRDSIRFEV
jgi:receptor tyrosine kinase-like orphan receptor 1